MISYLVSNFANYTIKLYIKTGLISATFYAINPNNHCLAIGKWYEAVEYEHDGAISMTDYGYLIEVSKNRFGSYVESTESATPFVTS
jgi:hypothetical protein